MKNYNYGGRSFAAGGAMPMEQLTEFNEGGRHEENSLGGIPQGMTPDGQQNLVEEGETKFDAENYIYSDSLKVDKELAEAFNLAPKMVGKTFADASKMAGRKKSKRQGDAIETAANEKDLMNLMEAQEAFKQARIEEKLQEIAELDPNALPALMGQGQPQEGAPQGNPAMGGQMQEAPMDEQAMMEQQMMAEQQGGGGQPSPEEMAMMEQQQNQMMGQQEGMMRSGGKLPKEVLKARAQSHMSPAQADAYVENYAKGGKMDFEPHIMYKDGNGIQADTYQKHLSLKNEGYGHSMGYGGYTKKRSYAPGGFMGANAGMMIPNPCGTPGNPPCPKINNMLEISPGGLSKEELQKLKEQKQAEKLANKAPTTTDLKFTYPTTGNVEYLGDPRFEGVEVGIPMDSGANFNRNKLGRQVLKNPTNFVYKAGDLQDKDAVKRAEGLNQDRIKAFTPQNNVVSNEFGGNLMQPMNQMGSGGKMCYGCGGKMHAYGGRMNGIQHKYGAGMKTAGTILDTAADFAKYIPVVGQVIAPIAEAGANVLQGAGEAKATDTAYTLKQAAFDAGSGLAGTFVPGAEQVIQTAGDIATKKEKTAEMQKKQEILNDPSHPDHEQVKKAMENRSTDKSLQNAETFANVWDKTAGMASKFINPGEEGLEGASDVADFAPDGVTENVTNTVGQLGDSIPIGNWADIDTENMPEMPENMATGGRMYAGGGYMGANSYKNGGGLWANIQAKKERMGSNYRPAQPGNPDRPTAKAIAASQDMGGYINNGGRMMRNAGYLNFADSPVGENEIDVNVDQTDINRDYSFKETPFEFASKYAAPVANLVDGFTSKYDPKYEPEYTPLTAPKLDYTESVNSIRRNANKVKNSFNKVGKNPSNLLALSQQTNALEAKAMEQVNVINAKLEFDAGKLNNVQKQKLEKTKKELLLGFDEATRKSKQAAAKQFADIARTDQANRLAQSYASMGAENIGKVEYATLVDQLGEFLKKRKKEKKGKN